MSTANITKPQRTVLMVMCLVAVLAICFFGFFSIDLRFYWFLVRIFPVIQEIDPDTDTVIHRGERVFIVDRNWSFGVSGIIFGLLLTIWAPRIFGLCPGDTLRRYRLVLLAFVPGVTITLIALLFIKTPFYGGSYTTFLLAPLQEEIIFRGFIYTCVASAFPFRLFRGRARISVAVIGSAAAFSLMHLNRLPDPFTLFQVFYTFVAGIIAGVLREKTGSILAPWLIHAAVNAMAVFVPPIF